MKDKRKKINLISSPFIPKIYLNNRNLQKVISFMTWENCLISSFICQWK